MRFFYKTLLYCTLFFSGHLNAQDFVIITEVKEIKEPISIILHAVDSYDRIRSITSSTFITEAKRISENRLILKGKLVDSVSLYRLHINFKDGSQRDKYDYRTTLYLPLYKGDSIYIDVPSNINIPDYRISGNYEAKSFQELHLLRQSLMQNDSVFINNNSLESEQLLGNQLKSKRSLDSILETTENPNLFFVTAAYNNIDFNDKNLYTIKKTPVFGNRLYKDFSASFFGKQIIRDIAKIEASVGIKKSPLTTYYLIFSILCVIVFGYLLIRKKQTLNYLELLTPKERIIIQKLALGLTNKEIAADTFTEPATIKKHLSNIYKKIRVRNRTEAVNYYNKHNK